MKLKLMRPDSTRTKVLKAMVPGNRTVEQIAKKLDLTADQVRAHIQCNRRDYKVGYDVDDSGKVIARLPRGKSLDRLIAA